MDALVVRNAVAGDLPAIAVVHKTQFGDHLLGQFSISLLTEFYRCFLGGSIFLTAEVSGEICGFVMGGEKQRLAELKNHFVKRNFPRIFFEALVRPKVWVFLVKRIPDPGKMSTRFNSDFSLRLLSIAVNPAATGKGVASALVDQFENQLDKGKSYGLSVIARNERAIGFYLKMGYVEEFRNGSSVYFWKKIP